MSVVIILAYEPAFFYCIPLLTVITFYTDKNAAIEQRSAVTRLKKTLLLWLPSYIVMATVCLNSGNGEQATAVWNSWLPCMETFPCGANTTLIGDGVNFFNKPLPEVFKMHFDLMWSSSFTGNIPSLPFTIYTFVCIPYLVVKSGVMDMNTWRLKKANKPLLTGIMLMQFIFVSPMYGLLSCDFGRTVTCIVISSLFAYHFLNDKAITIPRLITKASTAFNRFIDSHNILSSPYFYTFALFTLPLSAYDAGVRFESMLIMQILKIIYVISG